MVIHPSYYDACDVSCDVIYYVIAVCAHRMVRIFFLPYLGNRSKSDQCSYEPFCLESHILSLPKALQILPESPCITVIIYVHTIPEVHCPVRAEVHNLNGSCTGMAIKCRHLNMTFGILSITLRDGHTWSRHRKVKAYRDSRDFAPPVLNLSAR